MSPARPRPLLDQLAAGPVICAEGYVFELERRGYLQAGAFVPEVVLEHPEAVTQLHRDFVHAGSDIVEALTYYAHREKLRVILSNDTMMNHPIHLHGMFSEVESPDGKFQVRKHTVNVQPAQRVSFWVDATEPGRWAFHCHLLYHMEAGMFREVVVS